MADYILLTGARKNVGDFLIGERGRQLLAQYRPDRTSVTWDRFAPLDDRIDVVNGSRAVLLLGGPAYAADFHPSIYPLTRPLAKIAVPVIPLALGWSGRPADPSRFQFSPASLDALRWIHSRIPASSCRDVVTRDVLRRHGIENTVMTGCTAWHHLPSEGRPFRVPADVRRVVVTVAAGRHLYRQNIAVMQQVKARFPDATRYCVFHRGIGWDAHTSIPNAIFHTALAHEARRLRYEVVDAGYDLQKIDFYEDCDLHIGYRVHAHLLFLSIRRPSFLIHEDGRGMAASLSLGTADVSAWEPDVVATLMKNIDRAIDDRFSGFAGVAAALDQAHAAMREFVLRLP